MQINNQFPDQYSLIVFTGTESGFWNSISSIFVTSETERANIQLTNIVDFLEHEKRRDIPIIEANTDSGDFSDIFEKWGVKSIPWVVVLDESNKAVLSEAPSEFLGDKILVTMNIFPTMIASPPIPADYIILDRPPSSVKHISYPRYSSKYSVIDPEAKIVSSRELIGDNNGGVPPLYGVRVGPQLHPEETKSDKK